MTSADIAGDGAWGALELVGSYEAGGVWRVVEEDDSV